MFTNKHVIIAMIVAPILSILAWFAVGNLTGEQPTPAQPGQSYPLVEKSNCRYASGSCDLENEDFQIRLSVQDVPSGEQLVLSSSHPLEGVVVSVAEPGSGAAPSGMRATDGQGLEWRIALGTMLSGKERIRLVARSAGSSYFGEASITFMETQEGP